MSRENHRIGDTASDILERLIALSRHLGAPERDYAILAEGNTSARIDEDTFWVKASGTKLRDAGPRSFVRMRFDRVMAMLADDGGSDDDVRNALLEARVDRADGALPSVETLMHAMCLRLDGVNVVGHTHPTPINMITCSCRFEDALQGRLFPDEIVLCGPHPVLVPYVDPGVPLAREIGRRLDAHREQHGVAARAIYLQNHGFVALGHTAGQVEDVTAMAAKAARILVGTYALGGPSFLEQRSVDRIDTRPDEHHRQKMLDR